MTLTSTLSTATLGTIEITKPEPENPYGWENYWKRFTIKPTPRSVTILGKSTTGRECPFDTDEVWGVNNVASQEEFKTRKFDKLFAFDILEQQYTDGMKQYAPICSWQEYGDLPYPKDEIIKEFGSRYFTNTISYMLAYATYLRIPLIKIYGVDVTFGAPYAQENRGIEYWIGRAQERGLTVEVPPTSHLLRTVSGAMYGERDQCNMLLYLHERINLVNILPKSGSYSDALKAHNAWWVLFPKDDEAKAHNVQVQRDPAGNMSFNTPAEFLSDVHMPPEVWEYLKNRLIEMERKGDLPFGVISAYEKIVLSKESTK